MAGDDAGGVSYYHRRATDAEGSESLTAKSWTDYNPALGLAGDSARWLEWKGEPQASVRNAVVAMGDSDVEQMVLEPVQSSGMGSLDVAVMGVAEGESEAFAREERVGGFLLVDGNPRVGVWPAFVWDNAVDAGRPILKYVFQLMKLDDYPDRDAASSTIMAAPSGFLAYQSKDSLITASPNLYFNSSSRGSGSVVYRYGSGSSMLWTRVSVDADWIAEARVGQVSVHIRASDNLSTWSQWAQVPPSGAICEPHPYLEVRITMTRRSSDSLGLVVDSITVEGLAGEGLNVVDENPAGQTSFSVSGTALEGQEVYFFRVKAFDGLRMSRWSRTMIFTAVSDGTPLAPSGLMTEGSVEPQRVISFSPDFSWEFVDQAPADSQSHARVLVGTSDGVWNMWDSGKMATPSGIEYGAAGGLGGTQAETLQRGVTYHWKVKTWDDSPDNLAGPFGEASTFRLNRLPTVPVPSGVADV
jgi:hypothetical protein